MGYYINPPDMTKEAWLQANAQPTTEAEALDFWDELDPDLLPVCWVDNGRFTAAAIAYNRDETRRFADDGLPERPKQWYFVKRELLAPWFTEDRHRSEV